MLDLKRYSLIEGDQGMPKEMQKDAEEGKSICLNSFNIQEKEMEQEKYVEPSRWDMTMHFTNLMCPSIITSVGSFLIMTINTIFAG